MKVLFITPPYHCGVVEVAGTWIPLQFVYLAGAARAAGFECEIYDAMSLDVGHAEIGRKLDDARPDVVCVSAITATYPDALEVYTQIAERWPDFAAPHAARALLLVQLGRRDDAVSSLERALAIEPRNQSYRAQLAAMRAKAR